MNIEHKNIISAQSQNVFLQLVPPKLAGSESAGELWPTRIADSQNVFWKPSYIQLSIGDVSGLSFNA